MALYTRVESLPKNLHICKSLAPTNLIGTLLPFSFGISREQHPVCCCLFISRGTHWRLDLNMVQRQSSATPMPGKPRALPNPCQLWGFICRNHFHIQWPLARGRHNVEDHRYLILLFCIVNELWFGYYLDIVVYGLCINAALSAMFSSLTHYAFQLLEMPKPWGMTTLPDL